MKHFLFIVGFLLVPLVASASFPDVPEGFGARRAIEYLQRENILQGYPDGLFRPAFPINRAELLKVLVAGKGVEPAAVQYSSCFPDVVDQWFAPYVCYAKYQGWVQGYPDGSFGPDKPVSFVEAVKMLVNVRGYPPAPDEEISRRGLDPTSWFTPYLTTALLIDMVSYEQVWGQNAQPLQASLDRAFVSQMLYRSLMIEGALGWPLDIATCTAFPTSLEIKTYVDVAMPSKTNVFRQELRGIGPAGESCVLAYDANPFGRVTPAYDAVFLQPYPSGQPANSWTARMPLAGGRAILRGGTLEGAFRPEVFVVDALQATLKQLSPVYASQGGSQLSPNGQYIVYVGAGAHTLEALDLRIGSSIVLDAVQPPLTFAASEAGGQDVTVTSNPVTVAEYTVFDSSVRTSTGYVVSERRIIDIDDAFLRSVVPDPLLEEFDGSEMSDDPFSSFGDITPTLP